MDNEKLSKEASIKITIFSSLVVLFLLFFPYLSGNKNLNLDNPYYVFALIALVLVIVTSLGMLLQSG